MGIKNNKYNSGSRFKDCFSHNSLRQAQHNAIAMTEKRLTSLQGTKQLLSCAAKSIKWKLFILNPLTLKL